MVFIADLIASSRSHVNKVCTLKQFRNTFQKHNIQCAGALGYITLTEI